MAEIKSTNKYLIKRKYKTINGTTYPMDEYQVILYKVDSEDCGYIRPQYQWSATTGYICDFETYTKYSREVKMVSYDSGTTWSVAQPVEEQKGSPIAYDSYDCGKPMYRCVDTGERVCVDNEDDWKFKVLSPTISPALIHCDYDTILTHDLVINTWDYNTRNLIVSGSIGDCATEIDNRCFSGLTSFSHLEIGRNVERIGTEAFYNTGVGNSVNNRLTIPTSVTTIESDAFLRNPSPEYGCPDERFMNLRLLWETQDEIPQFVMRSDGDKDYPRYDWIDTAIVPYGSLMEYHTMPMIEEHYLSWGQHYGIYQEECTTMHEGWKARATVSGVTYYLGGDGETILTDYETTHMKLWSWRRITNSAHAIQERLECCDEITSFEVSSNVEKIGDEAFRIFENIQNIIIPSSVTELGEYVFPTNNKLQSITFNSTTPPTIAYRTFTGLTASCIVYVPCSAYDTYRTSQYWSNLSSRIRPITYDCTKIYGLWGNGIFFMVKCDGTTELTRSDISGYSVVEANIGNCVTSIGYECFYNKNTLTSVSLPNSLINIDNRAFYVCKSLSSMTIPNSVTTIGNDTFYGCSGLTSVTIGSGVTSIGEHAFYNCSGLTSITINATTPPTIIASSFGNTNNCPIYVPATLVDTYKNAWWYLADRIQAIPNS